MQFSEINLPRSRPSYRANWSFCLFTVTNNSLLLAFSISVTHRIYKLTRMTKSKLTWCKPHSTYTYFRFKHITREQLIGLLHRTKVSFRGMDSGNMTSHVRCTQVYSKFWLHVSLLRKIRFDIYTMVKIKIVIIYFYKRTLPTSWRNVGEMGHIWTKCRKLFSSPWKTFYSLHVVWCWNVIVFSIHEMCLNHKMKLRFYVINIYLCRCLI